MKFSSKVEKCGLSPMRKFHPYAVAAEAKGKKIYHLNIGQPDVQVVDLLSLCFSSHRIGVEFPHRGKAAFFDLAGELHLGIPPSFVAKAQKSGRIHNFYAQSG